MGWSFVLFKKNELLRRDLSRLVPVSSAGVFLAGSFVATMAVFAGIAAWTGNLAPTNWLPPFADLGDTPGEVAIEVLTILPVIIMSVLTNTSPAFRTCLDLHAIPVQHLMNITAL